VADANTITRIGGILKNVYGPKIEEQQNKTAVLRTRYGKADNEYVRSMAGDHFEFPARIGGNRAGVAPAASDDALPVAGRQQEKKFSVFDRGYVAVIKMFEKDILNSESNPQAFANHQTNEMTQIVTDTEKVINIDIAAGDGSGILGLAASGTASATQTLTVSTAYGGFGSRYIQVGDVVDFYSANLVTSRSAGAGLTVNSITPSAAGGPATVVLSASVTTTTGDVLVRGAGRVNKSYMGLYGATNNQNVTFQGLATGTYTLLQSNLIAAAGNYLNEGYLQQLVSAINVASGEDMDEFVASHGVRAEALYRLHYGQGIRNAHVQRQEVCQGCGCSACRHLWHQARHGKVRAGRRAQLLGAGRRGAEVGSGVRGIHRVYARVWQFCLHTS
jgi:hypothetical protein